MSYQLLPGDTIESQFVYRLYGQTCRNVWHHRLVSGSDPEGAAQLQGVITNHWFNVWDALRPNISHDATIQFITCQKIKPQRYRLERATPLDPDGGSAVGSLPATSSANLRRWCQRAGKGYMGRLYFPGIPSDAVFGGSLSNAYKVAMATFALTLATSFTLSGMHWQETLGHNAGLDNQWDVVGYGVDPELRVQRRREIGKGE